MRLADCKLNPYYNSYRFFFFWVSVLFVFLFRWKGGEKYEKRNWKSGDYYKKILFLLSCPVEKNESSWGRNENFDVLQFDKEMADNGRVHPDCANAPNPYHECGVACLEKIAQGQGRKEKKESDTSNGVKGVLSKKMDGERRTHPSCPKASNPFHECNKYCSYKSPEANIQGAQKQSGFLRIESFGKKKKGSESVAKSPRGVNNASVVTAVDTALPRSPRTVVKPAHTAENKSPRSPYSLEQKVKSESSLSSSLSQQHFDDSHFGNQSFDKGQGQSPELVLKSGNIMAKQADAPKSPTKISLACFAIPTPAEQEEDEENHTSPKAVSSPVGKNVQESLSGPIVKSMEFTFSGISRASEESDESDAQSVISDSCVSVGKYHVRANVASILQLIFAKYGDIAANYRLESTSLRAYYLECLCTVVQQLQSMSLKQLTKTKEKEMLAVVKDVETAGIDVSWLHGILDQLTEAMELNNRHETTEAAKADCDHAIESTNNELESMMEEMAEKEKAVADAKTRIAETRSRLNELELESSELGHTISSITSKVEKISFKPLGDEML